MKTSQESLSRQREMTSRPPNVSVGRPASPELQHAGPSEEEMLMAFSLRKGRRKAERANTDGT